MSFLPALYEAKTEKQDQESHPRSGCYLSIACLNPKILSRLDYNSRCRETGTRSSTIYQIIQHLDGIQDRVLAVAVGTYEFGFCVRRFAERVISIA